MTEDKLKLLAFLLIGGAAAVWAFLWFYLGKNKFYLYARIYYGTILFVFLIYTGLWYVNKPTEPEYSEYG